MDNNKGQSIERQLQWQHMVMHMIDTTVKFLYGFVVLAFLGWTDTKDNNSFVHGSIQYKVRISNIQIFVLIYLHFFLGLRDIGGFWPGLKSPASS